MKTALLFDLDGTLLDTLEDLLDATNFALTSCGYPARTLSQLRAVVGNGAANQIRKSLPQDTPEQEVQRVLEVYKPYYTANCRHKTAPYRGIPQALDVLKSRYPLAIVSNKPDSAVKNLCADWFPGIYALGESGACARKPAPDMVYQAMKAVGAEHCIYIGDSEVDILTAQNAGVPCLSVTWGFRDAGQLVEAGGRDLCHEPEKMIEKIEEMLHGK